jgi:hypothetical protein
MGLKIDYSIFTYHSSMLSLLCGVLIVTLSSTLSMSLLIQFPRAAASLLLYNWSMSQCTLRASHFMSSSWILLLVFFCSILNLLAVHYADVTSEHLLLNAFLSLGQIIHIIMLPISALHFSHRCILAYGRQLLACLHAPNLSSVLRFIVFAKILSVASAVTITGLPRWESSDGVAHYPLFLQSMGAFLSIHLGCTYLQVINPSDIPPTYVDTMTDIKDAATYLKMLRQAYSYLTLSLVNYTELMRIISTHKDYRDAMMAIHTHVSGDCESEVVRTFAMMMGVILSRDHTEETALGGLTMINTLHLSISRLDPDLAFTERQMIVFLSLFARNSMCPSLVLHEQLRRQMDRIQPATFSSLSAVQKHLMSSFSAGTIMADDETVLSKSPLKNGPACATTQQQSPRSQHQQSRDRGHSGPRDQQPDKNQRNAIARICFRCTQKFTSNYCSCKVVANCDKCYLQGSHVTQMCDQYTAYFNKLPHDVQEKVKMKSSSQKNANSVTSSSQRQILYDDDTSLFTRPGQSATLIPQHRVHDVDDDDDHYFFRSSASVTPVHIANEDDAQFLEYNDEQFFLQSELAPPVEEKPHIFSHVPPEMPPLLKQRNLTSLERGTSAHHGNSTNRTPFAHFVSLIWRLAFISSILQTSSVYIGLDTMCWHHFTGDLDLLVNVREISPSDLAKYETRVASGSQVCPTHRGDLPVILKTTTGDKVRIIFSDVFYANRFDNLLSIGQLCAESKAASQPTFDWRKNDGFLSFRFNGMQQWAHVPHTIAHNCHYIVPLQCGPNCIFPRNANAALPRHRTVSSHTMQQRLCFISPLSVKQTALNTLGLSLHDNPMKLPVREASLHGMQHAAPIIKTVSSLTGSAPVRRHWTTHRYDALHIDLHGPYVGALNKVSTFMSYTSNSGFTWVTFLKTATAPDLIRSTQEAFTRLGTPRHIRTDHSMTLLSHDIAATTLF